MNILNLGVLGCADIAARMVLPALNLVPGLNLKAVASRTKEKAEPFSRKFQCEGLVGYDALLDREDIDAVYIPVPTGLHYEWCKRALEKGKHCLVEKPIGCSYEEAVDLAETARRNQLVLFENFMFVAHSQHQVILDLLKGNEIGEIRCFRSSFGFPPLRQENIRYRKELGGGVLLDAGVYTLRAAQMILGNPLKVHAAHLEVDSQTGVDVSGGAFLTGPGGVIVQVAFGFNHFYQCNYEIWGSKGKLIAERAFTAGPDIKPGLIIEKQDEVQKKNLPACNHFANLLKDFYDTIVKGAYDRQYQDILNQARILEEVKEHAARNQ